MAEAAEEVIIARVAECEGAELTAKGSLLACPAASARARARRGRAVGEELSVARTTDRAGPVNSVTLFRVRRHFDQTRFDHDLLCRLID